MSHSFQHSSWVVLVLVVVQLVLVQLVLLVVLEQLQLVDDRSTRLEMLEQVVASLAQPT